MAREAVAASVGVPEDLYGLLQREAPNSFFDWTDTVSRLAESLDSAGCRQLSTGLRRRLEDGTRRRPRQTMPFLALADRQQRLGDTVGAWDTALHAADHAEPNGWDRRWDTGSKQRAYAALVSIDPSRGKGMAFQSLVTDLVKSWWYPDSVAMNLNGLAALICDESVRAVEVWNVISRYLGALFPAAEDVWDIPTEAIEEDTIPSALAELLCGWLDGRVAVMNHGAMRACVDLLLDGNTTIRNTLLRKLDADGSGASDRAILMVLDAVGRRRRELVAPFRERILELVQSPDQSIRWAAGEVGRRIGIGMISGAAGRPVLHHYESRAVIELPPTRLVGVPERDHAFETVPDSLDPYETIAPWTAEAMAIAELAELPKDAVVLRVRDYMRELSPEPTWNADAERRLRGQLEAAQLKYPFRRPRAALARRALHYVVRELRDGGVLSGEAMGELRICLNQHDAEMLLFRPAKRPREIGGVDEATFEREWADEVVGSAPYSRIGRLGEWRVIGERTVIKPAGERAPRELRQVGAFPAGGDLPTENLDEWKFFPGVSRRTHDSYADADASPENSWRVPIPVQTQEPPCGTSAVLTTTCATTEVLA